MDVCFFLPFILHNIAGNDTFDKMEKLRKAYKHVIVNDDGRCDVAEWSGITAIAAGGYHTVGLKADGTVVAVGNNDYNQCDVSEWSDIVKISANNVHTVGLKSDGTVVATGGSTEAG